MNRRRLFWGILAGLSILSLITAAQASQSQQSADELYEAALLKKEAEGNLSGAIEIFKKIVKAYPEQRDIAAKAQLQIGLCYEKLGLKQALDAFKEVIEKYPERQQEVSIAKERISALSKVLGTAPQMPTFRKIRIPTKIVGDLRLSPDGQKISLVSPSDRKLWIMPLSGNLGPNFPGEASELNTENVGVEWSAHIWSGDGKWIAFNEDVPPEEIKKREKKGNQGIYIVSSDGGKPKKVYENYRDARVINYRISLSRQGKTLAFSSVDIEKKEQHIYTIPVDGGEPKRLVDTLAREPVFSPDGKMIAYVEDKDLGVGGGGLWVVPVQGGISKLLADAGKASSPIWSPEGDMIAYVDKQDKAAQIHIRHVGEDGEAAGEKITINAPEGIQAVDLLAGWTPDNIIGAIFEKPLEFGLYTVPAEGGRATLVSHGGYPVVPRFSPDGKRIFHFNNAGEGSGDWQKYGISVVPTEGGQVTTIPIESGEKMVIPGWGGGNRVSPDGKTIVFSGKRAKDPGLHFHIWTLPTEGGKPERITESPAECTDMFPCWSPDGKAIAFVRAKVSKNYAEGFGETNIYIVRSDDGDLKPLTSESHQVAFCPISWSPDGKMVAYLTMSENSSDKTLNIIPVEDGQSKVVGKVQTINVNTELSWSPDSGRIAFLGYGGPEPYHDIRIISLRDGSTVDIKTNLVDTTTYHLDWSPDGKKLVFGGYKGGGREFWLMENFLPLVKGRK